MMFFLDSKSGSLLSFSDANLLYSNIAFLKVVMLMSTAMPTTAMSTAVSTDAQLTVMHRARCDAHCVCVLSQQRSRNLVPCIRAEISHCSAWLVLLLSMPR
jgi:hypothetical protein